MEKRFTPLFAFGILLLLPCKAWTQRPANSPNQEMEAIQYANRLMYDSLQTNRDYVNVLNQLVAKEEYHTYPGYLDYLAAAFLYTGRVEKAVDIEDKAFPREKKETTPKLDLYEWKPALPLLVKEAATRQVVMVNEEHRMSRHRMLTAQLLQPLYDQGYRYLALEALFGTELLNMPFQPTLTTGFYTRDPVFAEVLREAIDMGYTLVPYDIRSFPEGMNGMQRTMYREEIQARHLIDRILQDDPEAKILVHVGRGHNAKVYEQQVMETDTLILGMMAGYFRNKTGIDPLCIDQLTHEEHSDPLYESGIMRMARRLDDKVPALFNVLVDKTSGEWYPSTSEYDAYVVPALTHYEYGRPDWIRQWQGRERYVVEVTDYLPVADTYYLVQAFYEHESGDDSIPADQYAYQRGQDEVQLWLKPGTYVLRILDSAGKILWEWSDTVP